MHFIVIAISFLFLLTASPARAEHKLLITDVLDAREFEVEAELMYIHSEYDFSALGTSNKASRNLLASDVSVSAGLGHGVQISVAVPYAFYDKPKFELQGFGPLHFKREGWGDLAVGAKYNVYGNAKDALTVVVGLDYKTDTGSIRNFGSGYTDTSPYAAVSTVMKKGVRPYGMYRANLRSKGVEDTHIVSGGVEHQLHEAVTVTPQISYGYHTDSDSLDSYHSFSFDLSVYLQLIENFYLIPSFNAAITTSTKEGEISYKPMNVFGGGIGLYYYFR